MQTTGQLSMVAAATLIIYLFLVALMRVMGRRSLGQLSALDLLIFALLGSAVETAMIRGDTSLKAGLVSAMTLLAANKLITMAMLRSKRLRHLVGAGPVVLVHNGKLVEENLRRIGMSDDDVYEALREREGGSPLELRFAVLEPDGRVNVVPYDLSDEHGEGVPKA